MLALTMKKQFFFVIDDMGVKVLYLKISLYSKKEKQERREGHGRTKERTEKIVNYIP